MLKKRPQGIGSSMHSRETSRTKMVTSSSKAVDRETCTRVKLLEHDSQLKAGVRNYGTLRREWKSSSPAELVAIR